MNAHRMPPRVECATCPYAGGCAMECERQRTAERLRDTFTRQLDLDPPADPPPARNGAPAAPTGCANERDCTQEPWCRIKGKCLQEAGQC